jgi:hypothetical protein
MLPGPAFNARNHSRGWIAAGIFVLLFTLPCAGQEVSRRLILKDGTYQLVTKYEVKGDRVRYFSSEREEWEELPNSLVDWPATEKYEKDRAAGASTPEAVQLDKELEHEREEADLPRVAPGLRLPEDSGVFLLDSFEGEPQLVEIQQSAGDLARNTKGNILRGAINPVAGLKQTIELNGAHAAVQSHVAVPSIYISADSSTADQSLLLDRDSRRAEPSSQPQQPQEGQQPNVPPDGFRIVRTEVKGGKRILGDLKRAPTGKISQQEHFVKTTVTAVHGGWLKITPTEDMPSGEYALVEMLGKGGMNLYVWDFGVNPKAAANANPWRPEERSRPKPDTKPDAKPNPDAKSSERPH